jgi:hypothetical protein
VRVKGGRRERVKAVMMMMVNPSPCVAEEKNDWHSLVLMMMKGDLRG